MCPYTRAPSAKFQKAQVTPPAAAQRESVILAHVWQVARAQLGSSEVMLWHTRRAGQDFSVNVATMITRCMME